MRRCLPTAAFRLAPPPSGWSDSNRSLLGRGETIDDLFCDDGTFKKSVEANVGSGKTFLCVALRSNGCYAAAHCTANSGDGEELKYKEYCF